jgi:signal recognition particle GTPase
MLAAGDTFRAAAVEQLKVWGERNNTTVGIMPKSNRKIVKRGKLVTSITQILDHLLSWLDTDTSIDFNCQI